MSRFRFRLERVLSVRRHQEEEERIKFGIAVRKKIEAEMRLQEVRERLIEALEQRRKIMSMKPTIEELVRQHEYHIALLRKEERSIQELEYAIKQLEIQREKLIEARKKKRVLERLRETEYIEWKREEENREQLELDEIGLHTFVRMGEMEGEMI